MFEAARKLMRALLLTIIVCGCGQSPAASNKTVGGDPVDNAPPSGDLTQFYTQNVIYRVDDDIVVGMPNLVADIQVKLPHQPLVPANVDDFVLKIHTGRFILDDAAMTAIFNKYVFNYEGSPLSDLKIVNLDGKVSMSGTLHKGLPIPFSMEGKIVPNGQGQIVLKESSCTAAGIPVQGLMNVLGIETANLINSKAAGVKIVGDDVVIYPDKLLPPPAIGGFVSGVVVETGRITMIFDDGVHRPMPALPEPDAKNFLLMWGGNILINNHLILDAKLQEIDDTPNDPMYFYMKVYREQLEAGYVVADHGMTIAYLPDVHGSVVTQSRFRPKL